MLDEDKIREGDKVRVTEDVRSLAEAHKPFAGEIVTVEITGPMCSIEEFPGGSKGIPHHLLEKVNDSRIKFPDKMKRMV